jgi:hypothetical protein
MARSRLVLVRLSLAPRRGLGWSGRMARLAQTGSSPPWRQAVASTGQVATALVPTGQVATVPAPIGQVGIVRMPTGRAATDLVEAIGREAIEAIGPAVVGDPTLTRASAALRRVA